MQLGRFEVSTLRPPPILSITFSLDGRLFTIATEGGYEIWRTFPLGLLRRRCESTPSQMLSAADDQLFLGLSDWLSLCPTVRYLSCRVVVPRRCTLLTRLLYTMTASV